MIKEHHQKIAKELREGKRKWVKLSCGTTDFYLSPVMLDEVNYLMPDTKYILVDGIAEVKRLANLHTCRNQKGVLAVLKENRRQSRLGKKNE